jgi:hypothetical protein
VCASALSEVIPAVLEGSDGCLLSIGYPGAGEEKFFSAFFSPFSIELLSIKSQFQCKLYA